MRGDRARLVAVAPHRGAEAHVESVRAGDRIVDVVVADDRQHRTELLLVDDRDTVGDVCDESDRVEQLTQVHGRRAAGDETSPVCDGVVDQTRDDRELRRVLERTEHVRLLEPVPHGRRLGDLRKLGDDLVVDRVVHVQALERGARLAGVDERTPEDVRRDGRGIRPRQHDARIIAAELERETGEVVRGCLDDASAGGGRAREHHLVDVGMRGERRTDFAVTGHPDQDVGRQHVVEHREQGEHAQRRVLAGLHHHGVAHAQRPGDLPDSDHDRPVPRADRGDDAEGPVVQLGVGPAVVDDHLRLERGVGGRTQPRGGGADLEPRVGPVERLSLLARQQPGERLGMSIDGIGGAMQQLGALLVAARLPGGLCGAGGRDRSVQVCDGQLGGAGDRAARRGIHDLAPLAGGGLDTGDEHVVVNGGDRSGHRRLLL
ncbi:hypothetical protein ASG00_12700 [Microbacterium sp. Leaf351]|nr:hypothetical protein ASG00_12700 [Microbacterium sp. Leaf351]